MGFQQRKQNGMCALAVLIILVAPPVARAVDEPGVALAGEVLTLEKGSVGGELVLRWTGGTSPWEVFRSSDPATLMAPANRLAEVATGSFTDAPPAEERLLFYQVSSCGVPATPAPHGCATCDICDTWSLSWTPVGCVDHYVVRYKCIFHAEQAWPVFASSVADICLDIGMCDVCSAGVEYIRVEACSGSACSAAGSVPTAETPSQCGGGCCVPR